MERYRKLEKYWENYVTPEDYESGRMIKDSELAPDSEVLKHIVPVVLYPHDCIDGINYSISFDASWDEEHGITWHNDNGKLEVY